MPTLNPWVLLGALVTAIMIGVSGYVMGDSHRNTWWLSKVEKDRRVAIENAIAIERANQEKANAAIRQQASDQAAINSRLRADIASLRHRPDRATDLSAVSRSVCAGATGAELSRSDAEFLSWEAARADEIRAGLAACYTMIDNSRPQ